MTKNSENLLKDLKKYKGITTDSRQVKPGFIFVAVDGIKNDGHDYIESALSNGASFIVGEKDLKINKYLKVKDSRMALGELASGFYDNPSEKLKIVGVTGTKGKTTTCYLIYHILTKSRRKTGLITSIAAIIGKKEADTGFHVTSPDIISLNKLLADMVKDGMKYAVIEVSSHGIEQKRIAGIKFDVGVLTNIAPEHLDYHKTLAEYKKVKMSFIKSCKRQIIAPKNTKLHILPGKFNNLNAEAAIEAVSVFGIARKDALKAIKSFKLPEGRLTQIPNKLGISIYVDFAHTPESLEAVLKYLRTKTRGNLVSVFGCAGERDPYKRPKMGKVASLLSDKVILTAEDPRTEKVEEINNQIKRGINIKIHEVYDIPDRKKAIKFAIDNAEKGDTIGIFGKGHEKSMNLDGIHEISWSDKKVVEKYI